MVKTALILSLCVAVVAGCGTSERGSAGSTTGETTTISASPPAASPPPPASGNVTRVQIARDEERITFHGGEVFNPNHKRSEQAKAKMLAATQRFVSDLAGWAVMPGYKIREIDTMLAATRGTPCPRCHAALRAARDTYNR